MRKQPGGGRKTGWMATTVAAIAARCRQKTCDAFVSALLSQAACSKPKILGLEILFIYRWVYCEK